MPRADLISRDRFAASAAGANPGAADGSSSADTRRLGPSATLLFSGSAGVALSALIAVAIRVASGFATAAAPAVMSAAAVVAVAFVAILGVFAVVHRRALEPATTALAAVATGGVVLLGVYLFFASSYVRFPADILIWAESDFVNDILKFRVGHPLYTNELNNESQVYPPGAQLLTYFLAWLSGHPVSLVVYRAIELGFALLAGGVAALSSVRLVSLARPGHLVRTPWLWGAVAVPSLALIASNPLTNTFVHNLHDDALVELVSIAAYLLLVEYVRTRNVRLIAVMGAVPPAALLLKQPLAVWGAVYFGYLLVFDRPRSWRRLAAFTALSACATAATAAALYLLWGEPWRYWTFDVLRNHPISPVRAVQHLLDAWAFIAMGLFGALALLRGESVRRLLPLWLIWLAIFIAQAVASAIAWTRTMMGPASLIAGVWFVSSAMVLCEAARDHRAAARRDPVAWLRAGIAAVIVLLAANALGVVRVPLDPVPADAYRYVADIEREFAGQQPERVLLDVGTWVYVPSGVIMKDRATAIADRGYGSTGDFSGAISRIQNRHYSKILVRNLHAPTFWYDHARWPKSSGIRQALLDNYRERAVIPAVSMGGPGDPSRDTPYLFSAISVLVPRKPSSVDRDRSPATCGPSLER